MPWWLWTCSIVVLPKPGVRLWTRIQKSVQVILQTEPPASLVLQRRHPTVLPVIKCLGSKAFVHCARVHHSPWSAQHWPFHCHLTAGKHPECLLWVTEEWLARPAWPHISNKSAPPTWSSPPQKWSCQTWGWVWGWTWRLSLCVDDVNIPRPLVTLLSFLQKNQVRRSLAE